MGLLTELSYFFLPLFCQCVNPLLLKYIEEAINHNTCIDIDLEGYVDGLNVNSETLELTKEWNLIRKKILNHFTDCMLLKRF